MKYRYLKEHDIDMISIGAAFLGTGGGGDPYLGSLLAKNAIKTYGPIKVISPMDLKDDDIVAPVSSVGAPTIMIEQLPSKDDTENALRLYEEYTGKKINAVMPIEIGGENSLIPMLCAASRDIPVVDADAMGRAFPECQMLTFTIDNHDVGIVTIAGGKNNKAILFPSSQEESEKMARNLAIAYGSSAIMCDNIHSGKIIKQSAVLNSLSMAQNIGEILTKKISPTTKIKQLCDDYHGSVIIEGKIKDVIRRTRDGFVFGEATIISDEEEYTLHFQNEFLLATKNSHPVAMTPDLICILDAKNMLPITTEKMCYGLSVISIALKANHKWYTKKGLELVEPKYFGYDYDYQSVEELKQRKMTNESKRI